MNIFGFFLLLAAALLTLSRPRLGRSVAATTGLALILGIGLAGLSLLLLLPWALLTVYAITPWRQALLMRPALNLMRRLLPPISSTEREALDAGSVWWEADLFSGKPDWNKLLALPKPALSYAEQAFLDGPTDTLCRMLDDWDITHTRRDLPAKVWDYIRRQGFLGIIIPHAYGGLGFSAQAHSAIVAKIASRSVSAAVTVMVPNSLGPAELLLRYGTDAQRNHYLPRLARGDELPCFALTGPEAGSDAAAMPDSAYICKGEFQGRQVLGMCVTWDKRYITLAPVATVLGLAFHLTDPEHLLGPTVDIGITLALIPTSHPGVNIGRRHLPSNQAFMNGPNWGKDVFIPLDWVIGGREQCGRGWTMLMNCLAAGRSISLPALGTTSAKQAARLSGAYCRVREQFKLPIGKLEGVEEVLAGIGGHAYTLEAARRLTCVGLDLGEQPAVIGAIMKYQATERMRMALNAAMDIHGGKGICEGPKNYLAAAYQAIPVGITVEGANILTRSLIIFGQGAMRCHPFLFKEIEAVGMADPAQGLAAFDAAFTAHVSHVLGNAGRSLGHALTGARFAAAPAGLTAAWYRQLSRLSASFAFTADVALGLLGGELKRREKLSGRFADCLSELYLSSAVLKRWEDDGQHEEDLPLVNYSCALSVYQIERQLDAILSNFPSPALGWLLRCMIFPFGRRQREPADSLGHEVASLMMAGGASRDRLSEGLFISVDPKEAVGALEHAFQMLIDSKPGSRKLAAARKINGFAALTTQAAVAAGVISASEAELLQQTQEAVRAAIMVDDFDPKELAPGTQLPARQTHAA